MRKNEEEITKATTTHYHHTKTNTTQHLFKRMPFVVSNGKKKEDQANDSRLAIENQIANQKQMQNRFFAVPFSSFSFRVCVCVAVASRIHLKLAIKFRYGFTFHIQVANEIVQ